MAGKGRIGGKTGSGWGKNPDYRRLLAIIVN